ncbi:KAP P-loop domain protein [Halorubrum saccharovorum DSM 1137]|uniref:KAP P-loop domain protein n=1 Tax=Halorubrum saccharovorum DSM 1137 TaxID=1227484 RepID=M0DS50_9EURY|nr:P-loop NTPase fold protein [Halorubrum saccharovorum]ELZ38330.1 KAP P-loop domain protein [Halorubrum saccharovorum DSM 1137]
MSESGEDQMYLIDKPIDSEDEDSFGHIEYVDTLSEVIRNVDPPWHIGIFGEWGSGKSSIINLLYNRIRSDQQFDDVVCVEFDAWAHAEDSIRTELLLELDQRIGEEINAEDNGVLGEEEITGRLYDVEEDESITKSSNPSEIIRDFWNDSPILSISFVSLGIVALLLEYFGHSAAASLVATGLLLPVLGYVLKQLDTVTRTVQRKFLYPRKEWSGAHKNIFDSIIQEVDAEKVVISVDNLDRCESSTVYDVLVSLKTFLEDDRCVYLIPCDDEALESHLKAVNDEEFFGETRTEREFLRKFFQTHIRIPTFQKDDVENYAHRKNGELTEPIDPEAIDIIINAYFENPRRIKHAINRLVTLRSIAREREQEGILGNNRVTQNLPFLAKVSILEEDFPDFYRKLEDDPYLLNDINDYLNGESRSNRVEEILESESRGESRLEAFLDSTQRVTVENVRPFLNLSEQSYSGGLEDFDDIMRFLKTGQTSKLLNRIESIRDRGESFTQYTDAIDEELRGYRSTNRDQPMYAITNSLVTIFEQLSEEEQQSIAPVVGRYVANSPDQNFLRFLEPDLLFPVMLQMYEYQSKALFEEYAKKVKDNDGLNEDILSAFVKHAESVPNTAVSELSEKISNLRDNDLVEAIQLLRQSKGSIENLVTSEIISVSTTVVEIDSEKHEFIQTASYGQFDKVAGVEERSKYVKKLLELYDGYRNNQHEQINRDLARNLTNLNPEVTEAAAIESFESIREILNSLNNEMVELVEVNIHFYDSLPEERQSDFREWISSIYGQWNPQNIQQILKKMIEREVPTFETEKEIDKLFSRIPRQINDQSFISETIIPEIPSEYDQKIVDKTRELIRSNNNNQQEIGLRIIEEHINRLKLDLGTIIDACGHSARNERNSNRKRNLLKPIAVHFSKLGAPNQEKYIDELDNLLNGDTGDYKLYRELWEEFESDTDEDRKSAVAGDILEDLTNRLDNSNPDQINPVIKVLQSIPESIERSQGRNFIERLSDRLTDQNLRDSRKQTVVEQLSGFTTFYDKEEQVLDRLEAMLNSSSNESLKEESEKLLDQIEQVGNVDEERINDFMKAHLTS